MLDVIVEMAASDEQIPVAVVVEIDEAVAPSDVGAGARSCTGH